jgi:hypothetical protein
MTLFDSIFGRGEGMVHTCNFNSQEAKVFQVQGQSEIHSKILSLKKKKQKQEVF